MAAICDFCGEREAITSCDVCGSKVCREDKLEYGCKACNGGEKTF